MYNQPLKKPSLLTTARISISLLKKRLTPLLVYSLLMDYCLNQKSPNGFGAVLKIQSVKMMPFCKEMSNHSWIKTRSLMKVIPTIFCIYNTVYHPDHAKKYSSPEFIIPPLMVRIIVAMNLVN